MKPFEETKALIIKRATTLRACSSELNKANESKTLDDLILVVRNNAGWCRENNLFTDEESIEMFGFSLSNLLNSGNWNSGDSNSGNWNSGYSNSGDSNSGYRNSGAFCLDNDPKMFLFDKPCKSMTVRQWEQSRAYQLMGNLDPTIWVPMSIMTDKEKQENPKYETTEGYLKTITLKEAWANMWGNLSEDDKKVFTSLENFDADKFESITGIKVGG